MKNIKVEALLNGMAANPAWEIKDNDARKVMNIYTSLTAGSFVNRTKDYSRFYNGCMVEVSSCKKIHVFDGCAIINENNVIEVRVDKNKKLEKRLLKHLKTAPMIKNLIFGLSFDEDISKAV
ncbi:MAG: hypothetical protein WCK13_01510 [Ignavibacteriota bacterium]|nr:hypothetical protein [Ignavibacteriota bacterium]